MDNQHRQIAGYREFNEGEIALINEIKAHAVAGEALLAKISAHVGAQMNATTPRYAPEAANTEENPFSESVCLDTPEEMIEKEAARTRLNKAEPFRWQSIARTHMQEGNMALVRAVAQPTTF